MRLFTLFIFVFALGVVISCSKKNLPVPDPVTPTIPTNPNESATITSFSPLSGDVGQEITINGTNFGTDAKLVKVQFADGAVVIPKTITATKLTVDVPTTVKTGQITLAFNNAAEIKTVESFTFVPKGTEVALTISNFAPKSAQAGQDVTITGTGFGNDLSKVSIWLANGDGLGAKSVTPTQIIFTVPNPAFTGLLTITVDGKSVKTIEPFSYINPNAYVVKTIGISHIKVGLDDNHKLILAELYGGGNRVILKSGSSNKMELVSNSEPFIQPHLDLNPDITFPVKNVPIDNAVPPDTNGTVVLKLKGFNKAVTGYNQLNLVMCKKVELSNSQAYHPNLTYMTYNTSQSRSYYNHAFIKRAFSGDVNVSHVQIAAAASTKPYITRDITIGYGLATDGISLIQGLDFSQSGYAFLRFERASTAPRNVGGTIKTELVNINKGTMTVLDAENVTYSNIKKGGWAQVVEPADSVDKVFVRVTGFDPAICGFNQLRLFLTENPSATGKLKLYQYNRPPKPLTTEYIIRAYKTEGFLCESMWME